MSISLKGNKHKKTAWKSKSEKTERPWGSEWSFTGHNYIHGKILYIRAGERTSLKYHKIKSEALMLVRGKAKVIYGGENTLDDPVIAPFEEDIFEAGDCLSVQSGCPYRIEAIEDCEIIEIGNHRADPPIRIEDDYGRVS
jgi:mannose-6-phosphate isomerase-like protein (cupin superfamily)